MLKRLALYTLLAIVIILFAFYGVGLKYLERRIRGESLALARQQQIQLSIGELALTPFELSIKAVNAFILRAFTSLSIDKLSARPHWLELFSMAIAADINAELYKGRFSGLVRSSLSSGELTLNGSLKDVDLSQHIQLRSLGITEGSLSMQIADIHLLRNSIQSGHGDIHLGRLSKPDETRVDLRSFGIPTNLTIPAIAWLDLDAEFHLANDYSTIRNIELRSSMGEMRGSLLVHNVSGQTSGELRVALSSNGSSWFGPYLPLLSGGTLPAETRIFEISGDFKPGKTRWKVAGVTPSSKSTSSN